MTVKNVTARYLGLSAGGTPTTLAVVNCADFRRGTFTIVNPDVVQTLDVLVYRRPTAAAPSAPSDFEGFLGIGTTPRCQDIDVEGAYDIEFRGTASGGGISGIEIHGVLNP